MDRRSALLLVLCGASWGSGPLFVEQAIGAFDPIEVTVLRNLLAVLALAAWARYAGPALPRATVRGLARRPLLALVAGGTGFAAPLLLVAQAQHEGLPSGLGAIVMACSPLLIAMAAPWLVPDDRLGRRGTLGLGIGITGVVLAAGGEGLASPDRVLPLVLVLGAAAMTATYPMIVRRHYGGVPAVGVALHAACGGAVISVVLLPFAGSSGSGLALGPLLAVAGLAVVATALPFGLYGGLVARLGAVRAATANYLIPFTALVLGVLLLGEHARPTSILGLVLILAGVSLTSTVARVRPAEPAAAAVPVP